MKLTEKGKESALGFFADQKQQLTINKPAYERFLFLRADFGSQQERERIFKLIEEANKEANKVK